MSDTSLRSDDPGEIVESNISFVNALFEEYLEAEEISCDALQSYYVGYYLAQVENGGFSQFVYNSTWSPQIVVLVRKGMRGMKANRHLQVFEKGALVVEQMGQDRLEAYLASEYFGENADRDKLDAPNKQFLDIRKDEDLRALNAAWLRDHPSLVVLTVEQMQKEVRQRALALPDRERRVAEARAREPRYFKLIRALCAKVGCELEQVTAGDPTRVYEGVQTLAWHFVTDTGHYHMVESGGKAIMFRGHSITDSVCEVEAPEELAPPNQALQQTAKAPPPSAE